MPESMKEYDIVACPTPDVEYEKYRPTFAQVQGRSLAESVT